VSKRPKKLRSIRDLVFDDRNANRGTDRGRALVNHSLEKYGAGRSVLADAQGKLIAGNKTVEQALARGAKIIVVPSRGEALVVHQRLDLDMDRDPEARELAVADNRSGQLGLEWDAEILGMLREGGADLGAMFTDEELEELAGIVAAAEAAGTGAGSLSERFLIPPFSVLDARQGYWQERKRAWLSLGIQSELGRGHSPSTSARAKPGARPSYREIKGSSTSCSNKWEELKGVRHGRPAALAAIPERFERGARKRVSAAPGGGLMPAMRLRKGKTVRGDGRGREIKR